MTRPRLEELISRPCCCSWDVSSSRLSCSPSSSSPTTVTSQVSRLCMISSDTTVSWTECRTETKEHRRPHLFSNLLSNTCRVLTQSTSFYFKNNKTVRVLIQVNVTFCSSRPSERSNYGITCCDSSSVAVQPRAGNASSPYGLLSATGHQTFLYLCQPPCVSIVLPHTQAQQMVAFTRISKQLISFLPPPLSIQPCLLPDIILPATSY